ncbi:flagellar biosynthetic protein FliO [Roseibium suaedae]|uniref:Flagellar biosynthesis protein, FliO n=1 Tax=Roseibium suaedae TaxID=735517 RepID=A0A1M7GFG8_9HYPH|nr:flagellar biosynthetic protein FliO [Roseibium suaedae]SHM15154.1 Flagellar biosynthesis protein, FliO [Roseibium suaedae]
MYNWIADTFGLPDGLARGLAFAVALAIVLLLIALFVFILKRLTGVRLSSGRNRQPRLTVMDATNIDTRRRLLLIRRDNVEHLILVGGSNDLVIEQGIVKAASLGAAPQPRQMPATNMMHPQSDTSAQALPSSLAVAAYAAPATQEAEAPAPVFNTPEAPRYQPQPSAALAAAPLTAAPQASATQAATHRPETATAKSATELAGSQTFQSRPARPVSEPRPGTTYQRPFAAASRPAEQPQPQATPEHTLVRSAISNRNLSPSASSQTATERSTPAAAASSATAAQASQIRSEYRAPATSTAPQVRHSAAPASGTVAPAISGTQAGTQTIQTTQSSQVAGFARTLARPALTPSSGQPLPPRQVTPPSSGPAAKAKTAFLQPVAMTATDRPTAAVAPAISPAEEEAVPVATATVQPPVQVSTISETPAPTAPAPAKAEEPAVEVASLVEVEGNGQTEATPVASAETETPNQTDTPATEAPVEASAAESTPAEDDALQLDETMLAEPETGTAQEASTPVEPVAAAEDADLFEPALEAEDGKATSDNAAEVTPEAPSEEIAAPVQAGAALAETPEVTAEPAAPVVAAPSADLQPGIVKAPEINMVRTSETNAAPAIRIERPKDGPLPNPIEDEMAKLLEEMTGPQKS